MSTLDQLARGVEARIVAVSGGEDRIASRLLAMGFLEGSRVQVLHEAPFGGDPIAVSVRGGLVALRRSEASLVRIEVTGR